MTTTTVRPVPGQTWLRKATDKVLAVMRRLDALLGWVFDLGEVDE